MIVKINSSIVPFNGNPKLERNIKEELDSGSIEIVNTREDRYEMYDKIDVTTPYNVEEQYLIQADTPVQLNATEYQHNLTLFENNAFFTTIYPADRAFKVIGQTLGDILSVYKRELLAFHNVEISYTTIPQAVLDEVISFKEFSGLHFLAILTSLFRKIWAVPKVNRNGNIWDIYPQYHNLKNNQISKSAMSNISQQNNIDYATKVKSQLKNAVNERLADEVTWFPSETGYVLPRSSSLVSITSNLRYELDSDIVAILKAEVIGITLTTQNINDSTLTTYTNITIDMTSQIVQNEIWDFLPVTTSVVAAAISETDNVKNHIRYKVGSNYITNLFESGTDKIIFDVDTKYLINAIWRAFFKQYAIDPNIERTNSIFPSDTKDIKMRFKIVKQRNIDIIHNRKTKGSMNTTTTIHQQRDSSVEVNEYKKNLKIYSNRMGNKENSKSKIFEYPDTPYELFDYTDNNTVVTRVQNTYHNKFVNCEYEESDGFPNIEAEYALMRRSDPYTITAKSVTTNIIAEEFIEFSEAERLLNTSLESSARRLLLGLFEATTIPYSKVAVGVFKPVLPSWNSNYAIHMPIEASGDGNLITLHAQFKQQTIAGKTYYDLDTDTYVSYLNPLPYTDSDGRLENFKLYFTPDILVSDSGEYPLILNETNYITNKYTFNNVTEPIDLDVSASFSKTFQVSFIADQEIYIGNALAKNNYFIKDQLTTTAIKIYTSSKPYGEYDQAPRSYDIDDTLNVSYVYSFANRRITITPSININYFSIVKDGEILLAFNRSVVAGQTYTIHTNHITNLVGATVLSVIATVDTSVEVLYFARVNLLLSTEAIASTSLTTAYLTRVNLALDTEAIVNTSSEFAYYTRINLPSVNQMQVTTNAEFTYYAVKDITRTFEPVVATSIEFIYTTIRDIALQTNPIATSSANMEWYKVGDSALIVNPNVLASLNISYTASLNPSPVEWVVIPSGTPTINECITVNDIGNIKSETVSTCSFATNGAPYESATDISTSIPVCSSGIEYTVCLLFGETWFCRDYIGVTGTNTTYYECQLK